MINDWSSDLPVFQSLDKVIDAHATQAMLVIQRDSIKFSFFRDGDKNASYPSYSIAKSITSALVGLAIADGKIESENDLVVHYVPEINHLQYADRLRLKELLNMTSGLKYKLTDDGRLYYGKDMTKVLAGLQTDTIPGSRQAYLNVNFYLLGLAVQRAYKKPLSELLSEKIWKPINACDEAKWTVDDKNKMERAFCCIGATAEDYAKFGRLYLNKGNWDGNQILSEEWVKKSLERSAEEGSSFNYNYGWHIGLKEYEDFYANGMLKQHIYVHPEKEVIIVLLNHREKAMKAERINWWFVFRQIVDQLP